MKTIVLYVVMSMTSVDGNIEEHEFEPLSWAANTTHEYDKAWEECKMMENAFRSLEAVSESDCYPLEGEE